MSATADQRPLTPLIIGALGIVFGDIGTSPLYAIRECFDPHFGLTLNPENVLGILSVIFWTLILVIGVKYMAFVLEADNRGEGGIMALTALATMTNRNSRRTRYVLLPLGLLGTGFLFGESIITPAISVMSAMEGLKIASPVFDPYVIPLTVGVLLGLFLFQRQGTGRIGALFGPIIGIWFGSLSVLGIHAIIRNPEVLRALNPMYGFHFFLSNGIASFFVLGAVVLVITGGEALYADMGHFGRRPIRWAWFLVVMPALTLNYFGQGALLLADPGAVENPFFRLVPSELVIPMVVLATLASIIASQALISGVFSLARQAVQLGYLPRLRIVHTSSREIGQIYVPFLNWLLLLGVLWLVLDFQSSSGLAAAYGIAVTATMTITTILTFVVTRRLWRWSWIGASLFLLLFISIDLTLFLTCLFKFFQGGWIPITLGISGFTLMTTWQTGRRILVGHLKSRSLPVEDFLKKIEDKPPVRVPGTAIYMSGDPWGVPIPLLHNLRHNKVLHERVVILTIGTREVPYYSKHERIRVEELGPNFYRIYAHYGFMEMPNIPEILEACARNKLDLRGPETTFVLGRETILPSDNPGMAIWRERLFAVLSRNAQRPTAFFEIPPNQVIEVGIQVEI